MRWTDALMLGTWLACLLAWTSCDYAVPGESIARTPETEHLHDAVDALAYAWEQTPGLPSIDTPRCTVALAEIDLRTATAREWVDDLRLCPRMPDGCTVTRGGCGPSCATGVVYHMQGGWRVYLSPGESADGHAVTVRHEVAHVLSWCTGRGLDHGHTHRDVWGAEGVVWRTTT